MTTLFDARRLFPVILAIGLFAMAARNVTDPDLWWHLKTGEVIVEQRAVPRTDPFSYTRAGQPWVAHEWLSELLLFSLYRAAGWPGLILMFAAIAAATFFVVYLGCAGNSYVRGLFTAWGALAAAPLLGVRPQTLTWLLAAVWLLILERSRLRPNLLWWTAPLTLLWVNLHASYALGLAVLGLYLIGELGEESRELVSLPHSHSRLRLLAMNLVLDLALVPINPNGFRMYWYPVVTLRSQAMQKYIVEWFSPNFHRPEYWPFLLLFLATIASLLWLPGKTRMPALLLTLSSAAASLFAVRMIPFFVLISVPILSERTYNWMALRSAGRTARHEERLNVESRRSTSSQRDKGKLFFSLAIVAAITFFACVRVTQAVEGQPGIERAYFPVRATDFLRTHRLAGPMFNDYDWGGYLIWRLYPDVRVFIDGRADLYGEGLLQEFADTLQLQGRWKQTLDEWKVRTVMIPTDSALAEGLSRDQGWTIAYKDAQAVIFVADDLSGAP
jgi:hypothetical protein